MQQYAGKANGQEKNELLSALALSNYLVKSLSGKDPDLKNILARSELKKSVLIYTPDDSFDQVSNETETEALGLGTGSFRDFRLRSLALKNFRKYPDGDMYGLRFHSDNNTPCSLILVGRNAHGKSSLYDAMEYVFTGNVSEAKLRNVDCTRFIAHGDTNLAPTIQARLVGSNESIRSLLPIAN
ncbi:MAG: AAA family ATPase [Parabacteroides sp.]|nr:AAA family ATPase [Parabacteroides sp.]